MYAARLVIERVDHGSPARLTVHRPADDGGIGPTGWELRYGGVPVAAGSLRAAEMAVDLPDVVPAMDEAALSLWVSAEEGEAGIVEATCALPARRPTWAELDVRSRRGGVRNQLVVPERRSTLVVEQRRVSPPGTAADSPSAPSVVVYASARELVERRKSFLQARSPRRRAPAPAPGP